MRFECPHCGPRFHDEFTYAGDATVRRPRDGGAAPTPEWESYVYLRTNPRGPHQEYWFHGAGCGAWLVVTRDVRNHEILGVAIAQDAMLAEGGA